MTEQGVKDLINLWIVTNGVNAITAAVLNPILLEMVSQPNAYIGNLSTLSTADQTSLVAAINEVASELGSIGLDFIKLHVGEEDPNTIPPDDFNTADFYSQVDIDNNPIALWQYTGLTWVMIADTLAAHYKGKYNAATNVPALNDGFGSVGDFYKVTVAGNPDFGSGPIELKENDYIIYNVVDGVWDKFIDNSQVAGLGAVAFSNDYNDLDNLPDLSLKADVSYVDGLVVGLLDDRGSYDASGNTYPSSGGSGTAGAILKGDLWFISVAGTLGGVAVNVGDSIRALVDTPGSTSTNWSVLEGNIGYVPENTANKVTTMSGNTASNTVFLTAKAVYDWATGLFQPILTDVIFGAFINGLTVKTTPVDADYIFLVDSAASNVGKKTLLSDFKAFLLTYFQGSFFRYAVKSTVTSSAVTGTTAATVIIANIPIPANTVQVGDILEVRIRMIKTGTAGTASFNCGISPNLNETAANLAGVNQKICNGIISTASNTYAQSKAELIVKSSTDTRTFGHGTGVGTDDLVNIVSTTNSASIPWSGLTYFNISVTNTNVGDSSAIQYYELFIKRG